MKLIIDIPEERYEWIKRCNHHYQLSEEDVMSLLNGVKNGTPDKIKETRDKLLRLRHEVGYIRKKDIEDAFKEILE